MKTNWHLRVRAVICRDGKFLAVQTKNQSHSFLPGGHVEIAESIPTALARELTEELGRKCNVGKYLGAIENAWTHDDVKEWEVTHFFYVTIPDLETNPVVAPAEDGFDCIWIAPDEFEKYNMLPLPLRNLLKNWNVEKSTTWWASSM